MQWPSGHHRTGLRCRPVGFLPAHASGAETGVSPDRGPGSRPTRPRDAGAVTSGFPWTHRSSTRRAVASRDRPHGRGAWEARPSAIVAGRSGRRTQLGDGGKPRNDDQRREVSTTAGEAAVTPGVRPGRPRHPRWPGARRREDGKGNAQPGGAEGFLVATLVVGQVGWRRGGGTLGREGALPRDQGVTLACPAQARHARPESPHVRHPAFLGSRPRARTLCSARPNA